MAQNIPYKIYKGRTGQETFYNILPEYNVSKDLMQVKPEEEQMAIDWFRQKAKTAPNASEYQANLDRYLSGKDEIVSEYNAPWGEKLVNVPRSQIEEIEKGGVMSPQEFKAKQNIKAPQLPPTESTIPIGKQYIQSRVDRGMPANEQNIVADYNASGLRKTYGDWKGSTAQYNAMVQWEDIQAKWGDIKKKIQTEGIQGEQGQPIVPPSAPAGLGTPATGGEVNSTYKYNAMSGDDYNRVMDSVVESIGTTDLAKLISDFAGGALTTPEMELSKEDRDAQLEEIKSVAAAGLSKLQQGLAAKGMTFSGIRTEAEAALAADTLAKQSGINREFAEKIINAARQEQGRRETALKVAETNYNKALAEQGYVYNPFTDTIEQTLEGKRYALDLAKSLEPEKTNYPASYDEWQLAGGQKGTGMSYNQWLDRKQKEEGFTEKDFWSVVDKGKTDLQQGESWGNVWNRIKSQFPSVSDDIIDNALGISWREPEAYQKWAAMKKTGTGTEKIKFTMPDGTVIEL